MKTFFSLLWSSLFLIVATNAQTADARQATEKETKVESKAEKNAFPTIAEFSKNKTRHEGYFPFYWDNKTGKIHLEVQRPDEEFLYAHSLATGLGSNPVGLDRGQLGDQKVVKFNRVGPKVLLVQRNLRFRANTDNELEKTAVEQSFAQSTIWGGEVVAESDGKFVIDVTDLLLSDVHGVIGTLKRSDQGDFSLDKKRSAAFLPRCKAFPENTELEASLTFSGKKPGRYVVQTTPSPKAITLRQHHSFIKLPDDKYQPRKYDVRSPSLFMTFADYASPLDSPLEQRWVLRHRLEKKDTSAAVSEPVEPIVYYVDAGAPKQIQAALIEGASWWNEAYESAGFKNAFQVKLLPPDADPLDVRYNVIQWVHRSTRGWSYGGSVIDPRTGEIIKGHVSLGSLRVRQDQLLINSLSDVPANLNCACCGVGGIAEESTLVEMSEGANSLEVALARIRQLSAHEVGHTIGFAHNFAASTCKERASVMDYPAPKITIGENDKLEFDDAYAVGIGQWDKFSVQLAYKQFSANEDEEAELEKIFEKAKEAGMIYISDSDARPAGAAHPLANLWDNGQDPLVELEHVMKVRRIALKQFDSTKLPKGTTSADIAQYFTPIYLHHRYQLQAAGKLIGGSYYDYSYAESAAGNAPVAGVVQQNAIVALLKTIEPSELKINQLVLDAINPRPYSTIRDREILPTWSGRMFDPTAAAKVAIDMTLAELLQPQRLNRTGIQARGKGDVVGPQELIARIVGKTWGMNVNSAEEQEIVDVTKDSIVDRLIRLVDDNSTSHQVRNAAHYGLKRITENEQDGATLRKVKLFLSRPVPVMPNPKSLESPPGSPIGSR